jgi:hypothetical protein
VAFLYVQMQIQRKGAQIEVCADLFGYWDVGFGSHLCKTQRKGTQTEVCATKTTGHENLEGKKARE